MLRIGLAGMLLVVAASGQQYRISTFAGGPPRLTMPATKAIIRAPHGVAVDNNGNVYFSVSIPSFSNHYQFNGCVFRLDSSGMLTRVAGTGTGIRGYSGDGGPAISAQLNHPLGVAVDSSGNLYVAESFNHRIRKISTDGVITTVAGTGTPGYSGDGGPAASAQLSYPKGIAVDSSSNLYIADWGTNRIRKVSAGGIITTVAGTGARGYSGDGGPATSAQLSLPSAVAVDSSGDLYIGTLPCCAVAGPTQVRKVSTDGTITTVAGGGFGGDSGPVTSAQLAAGIAVDRSGNVYIADVYDNRVRKVSADGIVTTVAGTGHCAL